MLRLFPVLAMIMMAGCGQTSAPEDGSAGAAGPAQAAEADKPGPDDTEPAEVIADAGDPADTLETWARALEARDWETARSVWGESGEASGMTLEEFANAHEKYATVDITLGEGRIEGAAGTVYYEAPVTMQGELQSGEPYLMEGPVLVSRVNNVPGASTEQLEWHIESSDLRPKAIKD